MIHASQFVTLPDLEVHASSDLTKMVVSERHHIVLKILSICKSQGALPLAVQRCVPDNASYSIRVAVVSAIPFCNIKLL